MKAILTKFVPATDTKPGRIRATAEGMKAVLYSWPGGQGVQEAHEAAAQAFKQAHQLTGRTVSGLLPGCGYAHVFTGEA